MEKEVENLYKLGDKRYVKKSDFDAEIKKINDKNDKINSEVNRVLGKMDSIDQRLEQIMATNNTTLGIVQELKEMHFKLNAKTILLENDLQLAKKSWVEQLWYSYPYPVRVAISCTAIFVSVIGLSAMAGERFNDFMIDNGFYVALVTALFGLFINKKHKGGG